MKIKLLLKALKFACMPTLSLLVLLICGFFSISKAIAWISSEDGLAITLRVLLVIAEVALVWIMYLQYAKEDALQNTEEYTTNAHFNTFDRHNELRRVFGTDNKGDKFKAYRTSKSNIIVLEHYNED